MQGAAMQGRQVHAQEPRLSRQPLRQCGRPCTAAAVQHAGSSMSPPLLKICGVTSVDDALLAVQAGAKFIGMIMWPKAKRSVSDATARQIATVSREHGAEAVGVFVDESADIILDRCSQAGITMAQLHGDGARSALAGLQGQHLQVIYVMHAKPDGQLITARPPPDSCDWVLVDGIQGGSGQTIEWAHLQQPEGMARRGWLLAGGLRPENVTMAIQLTRPSAVDVSSGVCGPDGLKKDPAKIKAFARAVECALEDLHVS